MFRKTFLLLLIVSSFLLLFPGAPAADPSEQPGEDLIIGMSATFKGPSGRIGIEMYQGAEAYFREVNRTGGIHGRKIVLKAYHDAYDPLPAITNTIQLIEKDHAFVLFGYVGTPTVTRVLPLLKRYEKQHIFLFTPFTGAEPQRRPPYDRYVFNLRASYSQETEKLVNQFIGVGRKRLGVFYQIDAFGRGGWDGVRKALARHKLRIASEATYRRGADLNQDMRPQVQLLRAAEPDAVICVGTYAACAAFIRDARDTNWDIPLATISFVGQSNLLAALTKLGDNSGKDYTGNLIGAQVVPGFDRLDLPAACEYRELMDKERPLPPAELSEPGNSGQKYSDTGFESFLNAKFLVEVLRKMGPNPKRSQIQAVVESMDSVDLGIDVKTSFGPQRHQGWSAIYLTTIQEGRVVPIKDWTPWTK
jgi:branched-chain amino acid transport system substrate-binding protein